MLRKRLRRLLPDHNILRDNKSLRIFGEHLHNKRIWHIHRESIARAMTIGLFCCFLPIPFQMIVAAALAVIFYANLPLSVALVWISNPLTMPVMFYGAYKLGAFVLQLPQLSFKGDISLMWLFNQVNLIWWPMLIGCLILGTFFGISGYYIIQLIWRLWVIHHWRNRHQAHR